MPPPDDPPPEDPPPDMPPPDDPPPEDPPPDMPPPDEPPPEDPPPDDPPPDDPPPDEPEEPDGGDGIPPLGGIGALTPPGAETVDLQPTTTSAAIAIANSGRAIAEFRFFLSPLCMSRASRPVVYGGKPFGCRAGLRGPGLRYLGKQTAVEFRSFQNSWRRSFVFRRCGYRAPHRN
jgi:hypothetical protein